MLILTKAIGVLASPPGVFILMALLGLLVQLRSVVFGNVILILTVAGLMVLSSPLAGQRLLADLEHQYAPLPVTLAAPMRADADAIVVLGTGRYTDAPEYGGDSTSRSALERLRYAARLQRVTELPVLVSGGAPFGEAAPEAELMQQALREDFRVETKWLETRSRTTGENALYSQELLAKTGIKRIYLVTHAWHMPRAVWAFRQTGFTVVPAPMGFTTLDAGDRTVLGYLPTAQGLLWSSYAIHERLGLWWYQWNNAKAATTPASAVVKLSNGGPGRT